MRPFGPLLTLLSLTLSACGHEPDCQSWRQWGNDPQHLGASCVSGQPLGRILADVVFDPFTADEEADGFGDLVIHYQTPLLDGDDVYLMYKRGSYTPCALGMNGPECFTDAQRLRQ